MQHLWEQLAEHHPVLACKCGKCTCDPASAFETRTEQEHVHQFLLGLNRLLYDTVRSNLLAIDPLPSMNHVYATLSREEQARVTTKAKEDRSEVMSFIVQSARPSCTDHPREMRTDAQTGPRYCTYCKRRNHDVSACFELHEYPNWWYELDQTKKRSKSFKPGGPSAAKGRGNAGLDLSGLAGLNSEQWQLLNSLYNKNQESTSTSLVHDTMPGKKVWIIDSGATDHMSGDLNLFSHFRDIVQHPVGLLNGDYSTATKIEDVILDARLTLHNVLFDRTSRMLIGTGEQKGGLFYYKGLATTAVVRSSSLSYDLWHQRLGHPSSKVVSLLPHFSQIVDDFSRAVWIYLLLDKTAVPQTLCEYFALVECQYNKKIKTFRSDNGTEFLPLKPYFSKHGILYETSCRGTPQQNGRVERKHQHILNAGRALRFQANLSISF
ncbi:hypothetical protein RND81_05G129200 [Saponaria officinalis]|uniref:Integrase catalytic domain-containing protein n=1 Tax=Saponaria officinalis TaxID=3572 RepID=A0AAW1KXK9_SAPOF